MQGRMRDERVALGTYHHRHFESLFGNDTLYFTSMNKDYPLNLSI